MHSTQQCPLNPYKNMKIEDIIEPKALQSIRRIHEQMDKLRMAAEPARELRKRMQAVAGVYSTAFENYQSSMAHLSESWNKVIQPAVEAVKKLQQSLSPLNEPLNKLNKRMEPYSVALRQINELSERVSIQLQPLAFSEAYELVIDRYSTLSEQGVSDPVETLTEEIKEKVSASADNLLSMEFYLGLVIALFLFVLSQVSAINSEENIINRINKLQTFVIQSNSNLIALKQKATFYVVVRVVKLREGPSTKHQILSILHPNLKVKLLDRKSKWIKVEFFDYLSETTRTGWVYKKYLKMIK